MILQMNLLTKQKQMHRLREELRVTFGEAYGWGIDRKFGTDMYMVLYLK